MMKKCLLLVGILVLCAACTAPETVQAPTAAPAAAPTPTDAHSTPLPAASETPVDPAGDALPDRFLACVELEPEVRLPLRWIYTDSGDLWVWEEGFEPISLTGSGDILEFTVEPGGQRIVFSRGAPGAPPTLWSSSPDGSDLGQIDSGGALAGPVVFHTYSPDGNRLAFTHMTSDGTGELWALDLETRSAQRLIDQGALMQIVTEPAATGALPAGVTWLPGSHRLAFDAYPTFDTDGIYIYVQRQVWAVDADTGRIDELYTAGSGGAVSFSPDGTVMLLTDPGGIRMSVPNTSGLISPDVPYSQIGFGEFYAVPALGWRLDSSRFLVALADEEADPYTAEHPVTLWEIPVDGSPPAAVLKLSGFFPSFVFSRDASKIAFWSAALDSSNDRALHIAETNGGEHIVYAGAGLIEFLAWSPFDRYFVYSDPESQQAYLGDLCSDPVPLEHYPLFLRWLDTERFVYEVHDVEGGRLEVYVAGVFEDAELRLNLELGERVEVVLVSE